MRNNFDVFNLPSVPFERLSALPSSHGIYFAICRQLSKVIYVGQSVNIKQRLTGTHHRKVEISLINMITPVEIAFFCQIDASWLDKMELKMIAMLEPVLNGAKIISNQSGIVSGDRDLPLDLSNSLLELKSAIPSPNNNALAKAVERAVKHQCSQNWMIENIFQVSKGSEKYYKAVEFIKWVRQGKPAP